MQWYTTVGVPGGKYACKAESLSEAESKFEYYATGVIFICPSTNKTDMDRAGNVLYGDGWKARPAPPETAEWLEADWEKYIADKLRTRVKVEGGWLCEAGMGTDCHVTFIPVALASGITVIGDE